MQEITSRKNPLVTHMKKLGSDRAYRRQTGEFLCAGKKLYEEALRKNAHIAAVLTSDENLPVISANTYKVPPGVIEAVSPVKSPDGLVFSCRIPSGTEELFPEGRYILLENMQDPGNVGTVIRTANAFFIDAVLLLGDCADPYHPKTVRGAMGALFCLPVIALDFDKLEAMRKKGVPLWGTVLAPDAKDLREHCPWSGAVCIGSEGRGISPRLLSLCREKIKIPMNPVCESLNAGVAAALIMWESFKSR